MADPYNPGKAQALVQALRGTPQLSVGRPQILETGTVDRNSYEIEPMGGGEGVKMEVGAPQILRTGASTVRPRGLVRPPMRPANRLQDTDAGPINMMSIPPRV